MNDAEILKASLNYLWDGVGNPFKLKKVEFIPTALYKARVQYNNDDSLGASVRVQKIMNSRLENYETIDSWLASRGINPYKETALVRQLYRKNWILNMIQEAEANGGYLK